MAVQAYVTVLFMLWNDPCRVIISFQAPIQLPTPIPTSSKHLQGKKQFVIVHLNLSKQAMKQVQGVSGLLTDDDACE